MKWSEVRGELLKDEATFKAYIADKEREARIDELETIDRCYANQADNPIESMDTIKRTIADRLKELEEQDKEDK